MIYVLVIIIVMMVVVMLLSREITLIHASHHQKMELAKRKINAVQQEQQRLLEKSTLTKSLNRSQNERLKNLISEIFTLQHILFDKLSSKN